MFRSSLLALVLLMVGCSTPKRDIGIPLWRFGQSDLIVNDELLSPPITGVAMSYKIYDRIALPAPQLASAIFDALETKDRPAQLKNRQLAMGLDASKSENSVPNQWSVAERNEGQIVTDWRATEGRKVGILWWEKRYRTEVRHLITITGSYWNERSSSFTVKTEIRERPNAEYPWKEGDPELGRQSFESLKELLVASVKLELVLRKERK